MKCRAGRSREMARSSQRLTEAIEQSCPRLERGDLELHVVGLRALAVDAEPIKRCGVACREIAV